MSRVRKFSLKSAFIIVLHSPACLQANHQRVIPNSDGAAKALELSLKVGTVPLRKPILRYQRLEPMAGIEPATDGLRNRCSTAELHWRCSSKGLSFPHHTPFVMRNTLSLCYHPRKHKRFRDQAGFNGRLAREPARRIRLQMASGSRYRQKCAARGAEVWECRT